VAGVVLYHAGVSWMPGGFLGVDVFFVLSGYLITSLLLSERARRGRVDFGGFWARRARRLLPAVWLLIFASLIAASTVARDDLARTRADALASLLYVTNWHLIAASHSYFNSFGRPSLLQHLWSLAVEEQFYLVWPILLIGGLALLGKRGMFALTLLLTVGSTALMWTLYTPDRDPSRLYYGTDTRASTLLVGALLAFLWPAVRLRGAVSSRARMALDAVGIAALLGILVLFWRVHDYDSWLYRGGFLQVALVAGVLVAVLVHPAARLGNALGCRPLRWVGVRSYGIYLWHWPVMMLTRPGIDIPWRGAPVIVAQIAVTVALAALSYRFVEMPVRTGAARRRLRAWLDVRPPRQRLGWVAGTLVALAVLVGLTLGLPAPSGVDGASAQLATPAALARVSRLPGSADGTSSAWGGNAATHLAGGAAASLPRGPILAVGDSVMLGCAPLLTQQLGSRLRVDAVVGRQAVDTITRLAEYRAQGDLPATVIVQIGDNGPVWYSDLQRLRGILSGVPNVVLVNVRVDRSWQNEVNSTLAQFAPSWSQATIANWYGHSSEGLLADGVHPTIPGRTVYVNVILDALRRLTASGR
jgi:peptidoglycan/LPS O-acetylase OafA/YrhL